MFRCITAVCLLISFVVTFPAIGQHKCGSHIISQSSLSDPVISARRAALRHAADNWLKNNPQRSSQTVLTIPTVFHILHDDGPENLSKAQILDQMRIMNEDFRRLNSDTVNTPAPFQAVAADCQLEFRLAQLDPDGNCTDGIVRVKTSGTLNAVDDIKDLSTWDNERYLNVWVVKSIYNFTGSQGTILGYAYYPGTAPAGRDGFVIRADYVGSIEYAAGQVGRTATHEIGHYLDLVHMWGDSNCGDDQVSDTPPALGPNYGCFTFPRNTPACNTSPNGEMFVNYMDYSDDVCMNTFTQGQKQRMDAAIATYRSILVSSANHVSTGIFNTPVACNMVPDFRANRRVICAGDSVQFTDQSWNGDATSRQWNFTGGVTAPSGDSIVWVTFPSPGTYDAGITVGNAAGNNSKNRSGYITVKPIVAQVAGFYAENFDTNFNFSTSGMDQYGSNVPFALTTNAAASSPNALVKVVSNDPSDSVNVLVLPSLDLTGYTSLNLNFKIAGVLTDIFSPASLKVEVSKDCGRNWLVRYMRRGNALFSGVGSPSFVPAPSDWQQQTANIATLTNNAEALIRISLTSDRLSDFYLDDINITGVTTGVEEVSGQDLVSIYPNPSSGSFTVVLKDVKQNEVINILDSPGRLILSQPVTGSAMQFNLGLPAGFYYLQYLNSYYKISIQ
jgi:PKD repeat protein